MCIRDSAHPVRAAVFAVIRAGRLAVQRDAETNRLARARGPQDQMQIAGMKAVNKAALRREQRRDLALVLPPALERPIIQFQPRGRSIKLRRVFRCV